MRVPPLPADEWDDDVRHALAVMLPEERLNPEGAGTALSTLARHPHLTKAFLRFSNHLLFRSTLDARLRELAILRIAHRRHCEYEWGPPRFHRQGPGADRRRDRGYPARQGRCHAGPVGARRRGRTR